MCSLCSEYQIVTCPVTRVGTVDCFSRRSLKIPVPDWPCNSLHLILVDYTKIRQAHETKEKKRKQTCHIHKSAAKYYHVQYFLFNLTILLDIISSSPKLCPNYVEVSTRNFFNLPWAKSLDRLHSFRSILTTSIHILVAYPFSLVGHQWRVGQVLHLFKMIQNLVDFCWLIACLLPTSRSNFDPSPFIGFGFGLAHTKAQHMEKERRGYLILA